VELLLEKGGPEVVRARDTRGDLPLHMAAQQGHPMCTYNLTKVCIAMDCRPVAAGQLLHLAMQGPGRHSWIGMMGSVIPVTRVRCSFKYVSQYMCQ